MYFSEKGLSRRSKKALGIAPFWIFQQTGWVCSAHGRSEPNSRRWLELETSNWTGSL